jgi:PadR family transcriptional regulator PadR
MRRKAGTLFPLELAILTAGLDLYARGDAEFYGFEVAKRLADAAGARRLTGYGSLYKALARLEDLELLRSRWEDPTVAEREHRPRRRLYQVTPAGEHAVAAATARAAGVPRLAGALGMA